MSVFSAIHSASETLQPRYVFHWLWTRLILYLAAAIGSAILFFAIAFLYASFTPAPTTSNPGPERKVFEPQSKPISPPKSEGELIVSLPATGQQLPFNVLYKREVADKEGQTVGYVVGVSILNNTGQALVLAVESGGASKTVGLPTTAFMLDNSKSKKVLQTNLAREAIVTSPTFVNVGGSWQPSSLAPFTNDKR
jgi:hypothetical protein